MLLCDQKDGTTPRLPFSCSLTWRVMCLMSLSRVGLVGGPNTTDRQAGWWITNASLSGRPAKIREDPSIFAVALETPAVKAFGNMGQTARLCIIRDLFIAGHNSCELRRHLDSVSPRYCGSLPGVGESCRLGHLEI